MRCAIVKHPGVMQSEIRTSALAPAQQHQPRGLSGPGNQWQDLEAAEVATHERKKIGQARTALDEGGMALGSGAFSRRLDPLRQRRALA